jgi:hypothetical protein
MLLLQKAATNEDLVLELTENSSLSNPVYLFVFSRGGNDYPVISTDLATDAQKARFNKFTIVEGVNDPTNGSLILGNTGVYDLVVYEQSSTTNLDPTLATNKVYTTLARLIDSESSIYVSHNITVSYTEHVISL